MDKRLGQLVVLALASALLSCAALMYEQRLATVVFAALTRTISFLAFMVAESHDLQKGYAIRTQLLA